ncbi:hypothetical protein JTB14_026650, partial [Gonioctena quinquepunctata]
IKVDLLGIFTKKDVDPKHMIIKPLQLQNTESFISLSRDFIDFGRVLNTYSSQGDRKKVSSRQTATLTNNTMNDVEVYWPEDNKVFCVNPKRTKIHPHQPTVFEFYFSPPDNYCTYTRRLTAQIYCISGEKDIDNNDYIWNTPLSVTITLQGSSFAEGDTTIAHVEIIPPHIIFEACLPEDVTFQKFKVRNVGPFPVMYKFVPPYKTCVLLTPMGGIIKDSTIIEAQIRTKSNLRIISETWHLVLNQGEMIPIEFTGICALPSVEIGNNNILIMDTVQADTYAVATYPLKSNSCFNIKYVFSNNIRRRFLL